jgi:NAD(P)-dependent dehydrogenase (short-subunit alcohol dehydrogenase family)
MSNPDPSARPPAVPSEDLETAIRVLETFASDRSHLTAVDLETRRRLLIAAGRVSRPERDDMIKMAKAFRRQERQESQREDQALLETSGLRIQRKAPVFTPLWLEPPKEDAESEAERPQLNDERNCYVCKAPFRTVHFFYDSMCASCGDFAKRSQTADCRGRVALVTGGRVKIGFQAALTLLRAGAKVIVTTRFPNDAAQRFANEPDFEAFRARLQVHGLDLRHSPSVELFSRFLVQHEERLDLIINNACQTVRRPPAFYEHLLTRETRPLGELPANERAVLGAHDELKQMLRGGAESLAAASHAGPGLVTLGGGAPGVGLVNAAELSQLRYLDEDFVTGRDVFPRERYDEDLQQVDLRAVNSWRLQMAEVPTPELLEVHLVNAVAPFILNAKLKPLMMRNPTNDRHIVNVSAMEGQFYRAKKTDRHPHTNMAKAALNMMTRTSAPDYAQAGIFMNAVDTGWVTDEDPAIHAARKAEAGFQPPLDIIDGAARIIDPYFVGLLTGRHAVGQFLKDYQPTPW